MKNTDPIRLLSLDTALRNTGWCFLTLTRDKHEVSIKKTGVIKTSSSLSDDAAARLLISELANLVDHHKPGVIVSEEPAYLYSPKKSKGYGQCCKACYAILGFCHQRNLYYRTVMPSSWQSYFNINQRKKGSKGESSKSRSIATANGIIKNAGNKIPLLGPRQDHEADALNIGIWSIIKIQNKNWIID